MVGGASGSGGGHLRTLTRSMYAPDLKKPVDISCKLSHERKKTEIVTTTGNRCDAITFPKIINILKTIKSLLRTPRETYKWL